MSLYQQWQDKLEQQSQEGDSDFWKNYLATETEAYKYLLGQYETVTEAKYSELAERFEMDLITFAGFMDGISTSLKEEIDLEALDEESMVKLDIDYSKLFYNMLGAKADWLYNLEEWEPVLSKDERATIKKQFNEDHRRNNFV